MSPKSFWIIAIKLLAIYTIIQLAGAIIQFCSVLISILQGANGAAYEMFNLSELLIGLLIVLVYILIIRLALFNPEWIIRKLKLDQKFSEEKFEFNIAHTSILKTAVIIVGAFLFVDGFPALCRSILMYFENQSAYRSPFKNPQTGYAAFFLLKVLSGYFMMTDSKLIINFIERKKQQAD